jgi:hypothetical protein
MELVGEVCPTAGGMSLFLEQGLGSTNEVLTHVGGLSLFLELDLDLCVASDDEVSHDDLPWRCHAFYPWTNTREGSHFLLVNIPPHAFRSGHNGMSSSYLVMDKWLPWCRSGFSPGFHDQALNTRFINNLHDKTQVEKLACYVVKEVHDAVKSRSFSTLLSGCFSKVIYLMLQNSASCMNYVQEHPELVVQLVEWIGITSIREVLIRLLHANETVYSNCVDTVQWLENSDFLGMVANKFSSSDSPEVLAKDAEILGVVTQCASPSLAAKICRPSYVARFFCHALEGAQPESVLVHELSACTSLLYTKRLASPSYQAFRSNIIHGAFVTATPEADDVSILLNLTLGEVACIIQQSFLLVVSPVDMFQNMYLGNTIQTYEGFLCMVAFESRGDNQPSFSLNSKYAVQLHGHLILILVNEATAATGSEQHFRHVVVQNQNMHRNVMTFELEVNASMQMYWPSDPVICSVNSEGVTELIANGSTATSWEGSTLELPGVVIVGAKDKPTGRDFFPVLDHEQNTTMFVVITELSLSLHGLQGFALLIVLEPQGVYWILIIPTVSSVEVLAAHKQWDPGGLLSTMSGETSRPGNLNAKVWVANYCDLITPLLGDKQCFARAVV